MHPAGPKLIFCLIFCVFPLIYHMHNSYITYIVGMLGLDALTGCVIYCFPGNAHPLCPWSIQYIYRRLWLFRACAYKLRLQETMRLTDNVRLTSGIIVAMPSMRKHVIAKCVIVNVEQTTRTEKMKSTPVSDISIFLHESVIRGHHIFKGIWTPRTGEIVRVRQEAGNPPDRNALLKGQERATKILTTPS